MRSLDIHCNELSKNDDSLIRSCTIEAKDGDRITSSKVLKYELPSSIIVPNDNDAEAYLIATILLAMAEKRTLKVHGSVSRTLLSNLTEFRDAWNCWLPNEYHNIDFEATTIDDSVGTHNNAAIAAFSGGVDSTFTVWQHTQKLAGYRTQNIKACVMIRGLDIYKENEYLNAYKKARETLDTINIPLMPLRTNYRAIVELDWNHTHGTALASCLNNFKKLCSVGIMAATFSYKYSYFPWGSNPISDPLLSSSSIKILHDGAKYNRDQRIMGISAWIEGLNNLRVCYASMEKDKNCGKCNKCIRTRMSLEANGLEITNIYTNPITGKTIRKLILREEVIDQYFIDTLRLSKANNIKLSYKWSYYYMLYKSRIIRGILKPKFVRNIGKNIIQYMEKLK